MKDRGEIEPWALTPFDEIRKVVKYALIAGLNKKMIPEDSTTNPDDLGRTKICTGPHSEEYFYIRLPFYDEVFSNLCLLLTNEMTNVLMFIELIHTIQLKK